MNLVEAHECLLCNGLLPSGSGPVCEKCLGEEVVVCDGCDAWTYADDDWDWEECVGGEMLCGACSLRAAGLAVRVSLHL